ncbi:hypothetical protein pb186bvf_002660 [Paramecium bursaria]
MIQLRKCQMEDHTQYYSSCICVSLKCKEKTRLLCQKCLIQDLHKHDDGPKQNYQIDLNNSEELERILRDRLRQISQKQKKLSNYVITMKLAIQYIQQHLVDTQKKYQDYEQKSMKMLKDVLNDLPINISNILKLNNEQINELFSINHSMFNFEIMDEKFQIIQQTISMINQKAQQNQLGFNLKKEKDLLENKNQKQIPQVQNTSSQNNPNPQTNIAQLNNQLNQQLNILLDRQYSQEIVHTSKKNFHHAEISPNEQYLVYGGKESILYIHDLKNKTQQKESLEQYLSLCRFTQDSQYLFVGCNLGYVYGFSTGKTFNKVFDQKILKVWVINMYIISASDIIVSSEDSYVARFQVSNANKPLMIYCKDQGSIFGLEYNKQENIILAAGDGKFILAFDGQSGNSLMQLPQAHQGAISQIQLINQNKTLITLDVDGKLKWWNINYDKKLFEEIKNYYDSKNRIFGFYCVLNQQCLLYVIENQINIIDNDSGCLIKAIEFKGNELYKFDKQTPLIIYQFIVRDNQYGLEDCDKQIQYYKLDLMEISRKNFLIGLLEVFLSMFNSLNTYCTKIKIFIKLT